MKKFIIFAVVLTFIAGSMFSCKDSGTNPTQNTNADSVTITAKATLAQFMGVDAATMQAKLVYVKTTSGRNPCFIDFSQAVPREQKICELGSVQSPLISPNGLYVTFFTGSAITAGAMYVCALQANATAQYIGVGFDPHWWVDPVTHSTYIVYSTVTGSTLDWPNPGQTLKQRIDVTTLTAAPEAPVLLDSNSLNGGLSKSGRYLATSFRSTGIYDLIELKWKNLISVQQACNGSISPSSDPALECRMMYLTLGATINSVTYAQHEAILISDTSTAEPKDNNIRVLFPLPLGVTEWQKPEWSTNYAYGTAIGLKSGEWSIYLLKTAAPATPLKLVGKTSMSETDYEVYPHLWVP
jgi:hypothetical protein